MAWPTTSRQSRGYGRAWELLREQVMVRDQRLCVVCKRAGRITPGTDCDHIIPKAKGGTDALSNLQLLCRQHHLEKSLLDAGAKERVTIGVSGWPVD